MIKSQFFRLLFCFATLVFGVAQAEFSGAAGGALAWSSRQQYASRTEIYAAPEALVFGYAPVWSSIYVRPGARFSYLWGQSDMPSSLKVVEKDFSAQGECALLWSGVLSPSVTFGFGRIWRKTTLEVASPIALASTNIPGWSALDYWSAQIGVGLPLLPPRLVLEPFWRYQKVSKDWRIQSVIGVEATFSMF